MKPSAPHIPAVPSPRRSRWGVWRRAGIVIFWLAAMGVLLVREVFPGRLTGAAVSYRRLLERGPLLSDSWMIVSVGGRPAGHSHTRVESSGEAGREQVVLDNDTLLSIVLMGQTRHVAVHTDAELDASFRLQRFSFSMNATPYRVSSKARRLHGTRFAVDLDAGAGPRTLEIDIPDDVVLYSPATDLLLGDLEPGRQIRLRTFDPISLSPGDAVIRAVRRETISIAGTNEPATLLLAEYRGMEVRSWVSRDGRMLRQETPYGWTLETADAKAALSASREAGNAGADPLAAAAVPCRGTIPDPRAARALRLRLTGPGTLDAMNLASHRQRIVERGPGRVTLDLAADDPAAAPDGAAEPAPTDADLAATPYVQSDHPEIVARARAIANDRAAAPLARALAIHEWVHRNVRKDAAISLPSALAVLQRLEGDCNEHTYLYVALARAAGLPARINVGLVYSDDAFYYHAWPSVFVGRWLELDPTLGQTGVDATHVRLVQGELDAQLAIVGLIGRLEAEVE